MPVVGDTIFFNADGVKPAAGHQLVQFSWNFGDGTTASGFQTTHVFAQSATYTVVLSALDDANQKVVIPKTLTIGSGNPVVSFTSSIQNAAAHAMFFDGGGLTAANGSSIVAYQWAFGDGATATGQTASHTYTATGSYTVRLTVTDTLGRVGAISTAVAVP